MILASAVFDPLEGNIENLKWEHEKTITMDADMREPYFLALDGSLIFYFFKARAPRISRSGTTITVDEPWSKLEPIRLLLSPTISIQLGFKV